MRLRSHSAKAEVKVVWKPEQFEEFWRAVERYPPHIALLAIACYQKRHGADTPATIEALAEDLDMEPEYCWRCLCALEEIGAVAIFPSLIGRQVLPPDPSFRLFIEAGSFIPPIQPTAAGRA